MAGGPEKGQKRAKKARNRTEIGPFSSVFGSRPSGKDGWFRDKLFYDSIFEPIVLRTLVTSSQGHPLPVAPGTPAYGHPGAVSGTRRAPTSGNLGSEIDEKQSIRRQILLRQK